MYIYDEELGVVSVDNTEQLEGEYDETVISDLEDILQSEESIPSDTVSSEEDILIPPVVEVPVYTAPDDYLTSDQLIEALAAIPSYNIFPNTQAVNVFSDVLDHLDYNPYYVIVSGSDSYYTHLYYSKEASVSGSTISLLGDVTHCQYYQYRPSSSSSWSYRYAVFHEGQVDVTLSTQLAYTNMIDGYPDVLPYKQKTTFSISVLIAILLLVLCIMFIFKNRRY